MTTDDFTKQLSEYLSLKTQSHHQSQQSHSKPIHNNTVNNQNNKRKRRSNNNNNNNNYQKNNTQYNHKKIIHIDDPQTNEVKNPTLDSEIYETGLSVNEDKDVDSGMVNSLADGEEEEGEEEYYEEEYEEEYYEEEEEEFEIGAAISFDKSAWDDSALIEAWDRAYEEYRSFHSKEDKLDENGSAGTGAKTSELLKSSIKNACKPKVAEAEVKESKKLKLDNNNEEEVLQQQSSEEACTYDNGFEHGYAYAYPAATPFAIDPTTFNSDNDATKTDELFQQMCMSWYYAGFYTGMYQSRAHQKS